MTEEQIKKSIETGKLQLKFWLKVNHYGATIFAFIFALVLFYLMLPIDESVDTFLISIPFIFIILGIIVFFHKRSTLKFKSIEKNISESEILEIIKAVAMQFDWNLRLVRENLIIAESNPIFITRSGELITVIITNDKIYINSICSPYKRFSAASLGWTKLNVKTLIERIQNAK
jgi:hypothetical protein